jgi:hypothetical protein
MNPLARQELHDRIFNAVQLLLAYSGRRLPPIPVEGCGLVYSLIGHRIGYSHSQEVSR